MVEEVPVVQCAVAQIFKDASVQLVGPGSRDHADLSARSFAVFRAIAVRENVEFPHRVHTEQLPAHPHGRNELAGAVLANPVEPVQQIAVGFHPLARHGERGPGAVVDV